MSFRLYLLSKIFNFRDFSSQKKDCIRFPDFGHLLPSSGGERRVWEEERCGEERVKRNNRGAEMTREEKRRGVEKRVMD